MTSNELYIEVCRMYFNVGLSVLEIAEVYCSELKGYEHQTECRKVKYSSSFDAVVEIILNEKEAHNQVKNAR